MNGSSDWLPDLVLFDDYGGNWESYFDAIYNYFKADFVNNRPSSFRGQKLGLKRHPLSQGKEATFWHFISEGRDEESRVPDLRRCERICWPRAILDNADCSTVKIWENKRKSEVRICLWLEEQDYLFILAKRKEVLLPWTAYLVTRNHAKRKLRKEYENWSRNQRGNG